MGKILLLILVAVSFAACGFQLRNSAGMAESIQPVQLRITESSGTFSRGLRRSLERSGVAITENTAKAASILDIPVNQVRRDILSIGDNARVREFRIRHVVQFRLLDSQENELIPLQTLELYRDLSFDETEILASSREQEFVTKDLAQNMIRLLQLRLSQIQIDPPDAPEN